MMTRLSGGYLHSETVERPLAWRDEATGVKAAAQSLAVCLEMNKGSNAGTRADTS
jgi:hypothetical protein